MESRGCAVWSPHDRDTFVKEAIESEATSGSRGPYRYKAFPRLTELEEEDPKRTFVTKTLAETLWQGGYKLIPLKFYSMFIQKLSLNPFTRRFSQQVVILIKGSNAYKYLLGDDFANDFRFSDMDIVVQINPHLPTQLFNDLYAEVKVIISQTISQYKRLLDEAFCYKPTSRASGFFDPEMASAFKADYQKGLDKATEGTFSSPFATNEIRNKCSRHSFILVARETDGIVKVDIPHFPFCERIPLKRTPIYVTDNNTLVFKRDGEGKIKGNFELYRVRINNLWSEGSSEGYSKVAADFIDISISCQDDAELLDFWDTQKYIKIYEPLIEAWISVPDITSCIRDLYKMLFVYECPESKREKRQKKYDILRKIVSGGKILSVPSL